MSWEFRLNCSASNWFGRNIQLQVSKPICITIVALVICIFFAKVWRGLSINQWAESQLFNNLASIPQQTFWLETQAWFKKCKAHFVNVENLHISKENINKLHSHEGIILDAVFATRKDSDRVGFSILIWVFISFRLHWRRQLECACDGCYILEARKRLRLVHVVKARLARAFND